MILCRYEAALYALTDPLLPIRGHGLIELTKLIEENDPEAVKNAKKVMGIFKVRDKTQMTFCHTFDL